MTRLTRDVDLAEDLTQDALVEALEQWPQRGIPTNPAAWLMTTAKRRAIDRFRRADALDHGRAFGPDVGLAILDHVELQGSSMLNAVHGELLVTAGRHHEAAAFGTAANLTDNNAERELLRRRASAQQGHLTGER